MIVAHPRTAGKRGERGYALLVVIFLVTLLLVSTMVVAPNILTEGRREKEKEMIWRGKQYTRGVKLYYRKMGRFPTSLDDLTKPKIGSLRFMRQAYKDPMNKEDGSWRFIYVGAAGQLVGSLKPRQNLQLPQAGGILRRPGYGAAHAGRKLLADGDVRQLDDGAGRRPALQPVRPQPAPPPGAGPAQPEGKQVPLS